MPNCCFVVMASGHIYTQTGELSLTYIHVCCINFGIFFILIFVKGWDKAQLVLSCMLKNKIMKCGGPEF